MSNTKVTEALCNWIQSKGETPTDEDLASVTHALQSLYYAKGGQGEIPPQFANSVADMINGIAFVDQGGGGGSTPEIVDVTVTINNPSKRTVTIGYYCDNGDGYAWIIQAYRDVSKTVTVGAAQNSVMGVWATGQTATISDPVNCDICINNVAITMPGGDGGKGGFVLPYWGAETASFSVTVEL